MKISTSYLWRLAGEATAMLYRDAPDYEVRLTRYGSLILSGAPVADMNYAFIDEGPNPEAQFREFVQVSQEHNLPLTVILTEVVANQLTSVAHSFKLQPVGQLPLMGYQPQQVEAMLGTYRVERVEDESSLREIIALTASAFNIPLEAVSSSFGPKMLDGPGMDIFLAKDDNTPISTVTLTRTGAIVGIWSMATPPEHQRKGAGLAILTYALTYHWDRGGKYFYLLATDAGRPLYERIGFQLLTEGQVWVTPNATDFLVNK